MLIEPRRNILIGPLLQIALNRCWTQRDHLLRLGIVPLVLVLVILVPLIGTDELLRLERMFLSAAGEDAPVDDTIEEDGE